MSKRAFLVLQPTYAMLCRSEEELHCISAYRGEEEGKCGFVLTPLLIACKPGDMGFSAAKPSFEKKEFS